MIESKNYYEVICDYCGEHLDLEGVTAWPTENEAIEVAYYCNWEETFEKKMKCDSCKYADIEIVEYD